MANQLVVGRTLPFPGLSKDNGNLIGYYEKGSFGVRVAYNWRSAYLITGSVYPIDGGARVTRR